jgi:hypothetical protein
VTEGQEADLLHASTTGEAGSFFPADPGWTRLDVDVSTGRGSDDPGARQ